MGAGEGGNKKLLTPYLVNTRLVYWNFFVLRLIESAVSRYASVVFVKSATFTCPEATRSSHSRLNETRLSNELSKHKIF